MIDKLDLELTGTEQRFLAGVYADLCRLDNMTRGTYAEVLVEEALPGASRPSDRGAIDVCWGDISIQVKTSGARQSWHVADRYAPSPARWVIQAKSSWISSSDTWLRTGWHCDVYVFARHEGGDHRSGWAFYVLAQAELVALLGTRKSITAVRLEAAGHTPYSAAGLATAIRSKIDTAR